MNSSSFDATKIIKIPAYYVDEHKIVSFFELMTFFFSFHSIFPPFFFAKLIFGIIFVAITLKERHKRGFGAEL